MPTYYGIHLLRALISYLEFLAQDFIDVKVILENISIHVPLRKHIRCPSYLESRGPRHCMVCSHLP